MGSCGSIPIAAEPTAATTAASGGTQSNTTMPRTAHEQGDSTVSPTDAMRALEQRVIVTESESRATQAAALATETELRALAAQMKRDHDQMRQDLANTQDKLDKLMHNQQAADQAAAEADAATIALCLSALPPVEHVPTAVEIASRVITIDAFLSHKRTDAADFARVLNTELTDVAGLKCFLDQDADFELGDLMSKVRGSKALIFILSDHILESMWCALELREALLWGVEVILLTMHGAKWIVHGRTHDFPPAAIIRPEIAAAFGNKAIEYNRSAHKAVIDQLLQRMYGKPVRASLGELEIPEEDAENDPPRVDLTSADSKWSLELPPSYPLQVVHAYARSTYCDLGQLSCPPLGYVRIGSNAHHRGPVDRRWVVLCSACHANPTEVTCADCSPNTNLCVQCDRSIHAKDENAQHNRVQYRDESELSEVACGLCATADVSAWCPACKIGMCHKCTCGKADSVTSESDSSSPLMLFRELKAHQQAPQYSVLLLDGAPHAVQTGQHIQMVFKNNGSHTHDVRFVTPFRTGTRPEVFVALSGFTSPWGDKVQMEAVARHVDERGFRLVLNSSVAGKALAAEMGVSWVAFDPRLNRSWVHGEVSLTESTDTTILRADVQFASDAVSSSGSGGPSAPRSAFNSAPLVFLSIASLSTGSGVRVGFSTRDITERGCTIECNLASRTTGSNPAKISIRWLALPANAPKPPVKAVVQQ